MVVGTALYVGIGIFAYTSVAVVHDAEGESLSCCQALYVMAQIITTTGYGDITPKSDLGMIFSTFYILVSALLFSGLIMELIDKIVDAEQERLDSAMTQMMSAGEASSKPTWVQQHMGLVMAGLFFCVSNAIWMCFFMFYCDEEGVCEGLTVIQAFYFAIVTHCGVGFGDIVPKTWQGELFAAVASVIGVVTYINLVGAISDTMHKAKSSNHLKTLSLAQFNAADTSNDGSVDLYEFTRFILTKFNLVSADVLDEIKNNFQELDANASGDITVEDIQAMLQQRHQNI